MNGRIGTIWVVGTGAVMIGALLYYALAPVDVAERKAEVRTERKEPRLISDGKGSKKSGSADKSGAKDGKTAVVSRPKSRLRVPDDWYAKLSSAADRAIAKKIQDAQDADDREAVFKAAEEALSNKNPEVRQAAVDALSLQGEAAIGPLLGFVGDADKDVAESAYRAWDNAVDSMDGDLGKLGAIKEVLQRVKDEEHVKSAVGKIESFDRARAIRELAQLVKDGGKAAAVARESYEQVTGEPYESYEAATLKALVIDRENAEAEDAANP